MCGVQLSFVSFGSQTSRKVAQIKLQKQTGATKNVEEIAQ